MKLSFFTNKIKTRLRKALVVTATVLTAVAGANFTALPANAALNYNFTSWNFTPCGQTGKSAPTLAQCQTAYASSAFATDSNSFTVDVNGVQWWKPPVTANYRVEIAGAAGGGTNAGKGEVFQTTLNFSSTYWYPIVIGQKGSPDTVSADSGGGGGSTSVGNAASTISTRITSPGVVAGGGGGGGQSPGADGGSVFPGVSTGESNMSPATGRGAGTSGHGGPLTSSSYSGGAGANTGQYIGSSPNTTSYGFAEWENSSGVPHGGSFGLGLGGDGGYPNGGASCDCVPGGGGGGGGGGYSSGGGGGYNADGTGGGGGGGTSFLGPASAWAASSASTNMYATNSGDGYLKISYLASTTATTNFTGSMSGTQAVGSTVTATSAVSFASVDPGSQTSWKWQYGSDANAGYGGSAGITDIPGATSSSLVIPASVAGYWIRPIQVVTDSDGNVWYFPLNTNQVKVAYTHQITGTPPDAYIGQSYSYSFGTSGYVGSSGTSGFSKLSGTFPPGLSISVSGTLSGTTTATGTYTFTVGHSDVYETASQSYTITVWPTITMAATASKSCAWEAACSFQVVASSPSNETLTYSLISGTMPTGMSLDPATGLISGYYNQNAGTVTLKIQATAPSGAFAIQTLSFTNTTLSTWGQIQSPTFTASATWNPTTPPTVSVSWTETAPAPASGLTVTTTTPTICSVPSGYVTSPITITALAKGSCNFKLTAGYDGTHQSYNSNVQTWTINGVAQSTVTVTQASGSLQWGTTPPTVTVQATGGSGTGSYVFSTSTPTICVIDPTTGVVNWILYGACEADAQKLGDSTYAPSILRGVILTPVTKAQTTPVVVSTAPSSVAWTSGGTFTVAATGGDFSPGVIPSYSYGSLKTNYCTVSPSTGVVTIVNAGPCQIVARANASGGLAQGVYGAATTINITGIAQAALTLTANSGNAVILSSGSTTIAFSGGSGTGAWGWSVDSSSSSLCSGSGSGSATGTLYFTHAGNCLINLTKAAQGGYLDLTQQIGVAIGKSNQATVSGSFSPTSSTYNPTTPATVTITGTGGSGTGTYSYVVDSSATSICTLSGNTVTSIGAGTCVVNVMRNGDSDYVDSAYVAKSVVFAKASQATVTVTANRLTLSASDSTPLIVTATGGNGTGAYTYTSNNTAFCTVDANTGVVTPVAVSSTACKIYAVRAADSNFAASAQSAMLTINVTLLTQATLNASSTVTTTTYGAGTFTVSSSGGSGNGSTSYSSGNSAICTVVSTTGVVSIVAPGSCVITATKAADTNYLAATASVTITINKATQATFTATASPSSGTFGSLTSSSVSGSGGSGGGALSWSSADTSICTVGITGQVNVLTAGSCVITVTRAGGANYNDISASVTITISKATQATFTATASASTGTYLDGVSYSVSSSGGTGAGAVSYASNSASVCSVNNSTGAVTILTAGTCSITATKSGGTNYSDASKTVTITIAKTSQSAITASVDNAAPDYSDSPKATAQVSYTGGSGTGAVTYSTTNTTICSVDSATGLVTDIAKGKCIVTVSIAADASYNAASASVTIRFGKLDQAAVTVSSTRTSVVYGAGSSITVSLTGGSGTGSTTYATSSANCSVNASTGVVTYTNAGSCVITATKSGDIDYADASGSVTITVTQASQSAVTATLSKASTTYANGDSITASYTGGSGTGSVSYSTSSSACSVDATTGAVTVLTGGSCVITVTIAADNNYTAASANVTLTIAKAAQASASASADNASVTFGDGTVITVSFSGGSSSGAVTFSTSSSACSVDSTTGVVTVVSGGTCVVTATKAADSSYLAISANATITIAKTSQAAFNGSSSSNTTYGSATVVTISGTGGSGTGAISFTSTTTGVCTVNASTGVITIVTAGSCVITVTKAADTNYNSVSDTVTVTIAKASQAAITANSTRTSATYGDGVTTTASLSGGSGTGATSFSTSSSACSVNASTGLVTILTAGSCVITATKAADTNYLVGSSTVTITIAKATQATLTASKSGDTTYGSATVVTVSTSGGSGSGAVSFASTTTGVCSVDSTTGVITIVTAGTCSITATKDTDSSYLAATGTVSITIAKTTQATVTATPSRTTGVYADAVATSVSGSGGSGTGSFSYASTTASVCSVNASTGVVTILTAGTCSITVTKAADTNYNSAVGSTSIVVSKASQATVTATKSANTTYGSATQVTVTGSGGSGTGSFSYASTTTGICTINASTGVIAIVSAGDCVLTATKAADTSYNAASGNVTITIAKATQAAVTASATRTTSTYADGSSNTVALSGGSGTGSTSFASTTTSVCSIDPASGALTVLTAGTCSITVTKAADTNYNVATASITITINKATQATFTVSSAPSNSTFGSSTTVTISGTGGSGTGSVSYATTTSSVCSVNASTGVITILTAGTCSVTATKAADVNYNVASGSTSVVIGKATQSALTLTPANSSVVFGDGQSANVTAAGGSGNGSVTYASNSTGICSVNSTTGAVTILTAGTCSITATKAADTNYNSATASASITVSKTAQATVVVSGNQSLTFSTSNPTSQLSVTGGSGTGSVSYDTATANVCVVSAGGLVTGLHAGTCVINVTKAGDTNYNSATASYTITIAKSAQATVVVSGSANLNYSASNAVTTQLNVTGGSSSGAVSFAVDSTSTTVCSVSANGLVTVLTAGTCLINVTKAGDNDYLDRSSSFTVNIAKAAQATLIVRTAGDLNYNPTNPATTTVSIASGGSGTGSATFSTSSTACSVVGNVVTALGAGTCVIDVTKAGDTNYNSATTSYTVIVGKSLQTSLFATPSRTTLKFGDLANNSATVTFTGGSGTGAVNWFVDPSTSGVCSVDFSATPAVVSALTGGTCIVNITKAGDDNYAPAATSVTFTIQKNAQAQLDVFSTKTTAIKGETATLSASGGSTGSNITYSVVTGATVCSISGTTLTFIGAGTCTIKATRGGDANYDAVDSAPISLSATKADQSQLVVAQSAGMLPNVAIGGKSSTSWNVTGGNGDGAITVKNVSGCYANVTGNVLTATAGTSSGNCTIDIEKAESSDYRATSYRISLTVFDLPSTPAIQTPVLTDTTSADGVQVQIPWTLPNIGNFVAPITGYEVQTKTGSNWQVADGGNVSGATANMATIAVTPWTSIYVRVATLSDYATANTRSWSTFGGNTAQAFTVPGLVTNLSVDSVSAAAIDSVNVTGVGFDPTLTPTVLLEAPAPIFNVAGVMQNTIQVQASVANSTSLSFRLPGEKLPAGMDSVDVSAKVVATNNMQSTPGTFTITSGDESVDIGLDPKTGRMTPKINTIFEGTYTLSYSSTNKQKVFTSYVCVKTVKVKTKTVCKSYNWLDSAVCKVSQVLPSNPSKVRRLITFKTYCQLTPAAKASLTTTNAPSLTRVATFVRLYPKTHLPYVLVKGKKTLVLKVSTSTKVIKLHG